MSDTLINQINRRSISTQQFASYLLKQYSLPSLDDAYKAARLILLDAGEITSRTKLDKVLVDIARQSGIIISKSLDEVTSELGNFSVSEAAFSAELISDYSDAKIKVSAQDFVKSYVNKSIMSLESNNSSVSGVWSQFTGKNKSETVDIIKAAVTTGYSRNETISQIIKRVKMSVNGVATNKINTLIRTGVQHYAQQANNALRDDNLDVLDREYPITTWDSRRSVTCTSLEAKYGVNGSTSKGWPVGKSPVGYPVYHYGCRTIVRAVPKGVKLEGERPAITGVKGEEGKEAFERKEKLADKRLENGGSGVVKYTGRKDNAFKPELIKVDTKLSKFLRDQPTWYTEKLLGKTKSDAFRSGKIDLSQLTDKNLKPLTIEQLDL